MSSSEVTDWLAYQAYCPSEAWQVGAQLSALIFNQYARRPKSAANFLPHRKPVARPLTDDQVKNIMALF